MNFCPAPGFVSVVITTAVSRSPFSGVADNNKFFLWLAKNGRLLGKAHALLPSEAHENIVPPAGVGVVGRIKFS
jgi:hypothetical protein